MANQKRMEPQHVSLKGFVIFSIIVIALTVIASGPKSITKSIGTRTAYVAPPSSNKILCDEYNIKPILNRRIQDFATLNESTNGCVKVELNNKQFILHFNPAHQLRYDCYELESGVYDVQLFCPGMDRPIVFPRHNYNFDLTKGSCSQSPWRLVGMAKCVFKMS